MPLSQSQLAKITRKLDERYELLIREVRDALADSKNQQYVELIDRSPADLGDQSVADMLADLNLAIIDRHIHEVRDIEDAKARIKDGTFGICIDCAQDIGFDRLLANPTAKRCLVCQELREKTYAHEGTPTL